MAQQKGADGAVDRWTVPTHTLDEEDLEGIGTALRPDYEDVLRQMRQERQDRYRGRHKLQYPSLPEEGDEDARLEMRALRNTFLNGPEIIPTPSNGLMCGMEAVIRSWAAQQPDISPPTREELGLAFQELLQDEDIFGATLDAGLGFENLSEDQVAGVLHTWGRNRGLNIRLGLIIGAWIPDVTIRMASTPDDTDLPTRIV
ncbi:hypothetical protein FOPE_00882 [Fonsecaea pedrosoi]|nr:hypothetical protein FOPE_00882 [Fonsecaea pedrosoi]